MSCTSTEIEAGIGSQIDERARELTRDLPCLRDGTCVLGRTVVSGCSTEKELTRTRRSLAGGHQLVEIEAAIVYNNDEDVEIGKQYALSLFILAVSQ